MSPWYCSFPVHSSRLLKETWSLNTSSNRSTIDKVTPNTHRSCYVQSSAPPMQVGCVCSSSLASPQSIFRAPHCSVPLAKPPTSKPPIPTPAASKHLPNYILLPTCNHIFLLFILLLGSWTRDAPVAQENCLPSPCRSMTTAILSFAQGALQEVTARGGPNWLNQVGPHSP